MKIVLLGDLHGNLPATLAMERMLNTVKPDKVYFLGDAVGKGPQNRETCDWVRAHCDVCVGGNWDYGIGGKEFPGDHYYWNQLGEERMAWLNGLPREAVLTISGLRFRLFHGRPVTELLSAQSPKEELLAAFDNGEEQFDGIIFADSHRPFIRTLRGYAMNCGSVGNSLGVTNAHALMLEGGDQKGDALMMTVLSVPYDNASAVAAAQAEPNMPFKDKYITEITTGVYSR